MNADGSKELSRVTVICEGGPFDGTHTTDLTIEECDRSPEERVADFFYWSTSNGTIGKRCWNTSPYAPQVMETHGVDEAIDRRLDTPHVYEITQHIKSPRSVTLRAKYIPPNQAVQRPRLLSESQDSNDD